MCRDTNGTVADHIKTFGSGGLCIHENLWALCPTHHLEKGNLGLTTFVNKYKQLEPYLKGKGWEYIEFTDKWVRTMDGELQVQLPQEL